MTLTKIHFNLILEVDTDDNVLTIDRVSEYLKQTLLDSWWIESFTFIKTYDEENKK